MRALHTIGSVRPETGGPARSSQGLAVGLETCGVETWLLSYSDGDQPWFRDVKHFVAAKHAGYSGYCEAARDAVAQARPELIHCYGVWSPYVRVTILEAVRGGIPFVVAPQGCFSPWALKYKWLKKFIAWWVYQRRDLNKAAAFHATSEEEAKDIRRMGFKQPIFVVPNGVEVPRKTGAGEQRHYAVEGGGDCSAGGEARSVLMASGVSGEATRPFNNKATRVALFLSRLHPGKGLLDLADAWAKVKAEEDRYGSVSGENDVGEPRAASGLFSHWRMRVVGPDSYGHKAEVIEKIKALGIENEWEFVDEVSDDAKWQEYANADLFIHPSHSENFGISIAEALYAKLPVITTKGTPWQELLGQAKEVGRNTEGRGRVPMEGERRGWQQAASDNGGGESAISRSASQENRCSAIANSGRCGWWVDIGSEPLATVLREAIGLSDQERAAMGQNGRLLVESKYTWPVIADQMKAAYAWLLMGGRKPEWVRLS